MTDAMPPRPCLNCGTSLAGPFCHRCGQKDQAVRVGLKHLLHDVLHDLLHFDHKLWSSFWLLVSRPGFLAQEYLEGRRTRHVPPFRLYVVASFVMFFMFAMVPTGQRRHGEGGKPDHGTVQVEVHEQPDEERRPAPPPADREVAGAHGKTKPAWAAALQRRAKEAQKDPEHFKHAFFANLSKALFLLMPLFAGLLMLLHLRSNTWFMDHMVVSLHHHVVSFLVILALMGLAFLPGEDWGTVPGLLLLLAPPMHLAITLQRLHRRGWFRSCVKAAVVSVSYGFVVGVSLLGLLFLALPK